VNQPLSSLDLSFLTLEGPNTPMHLGAVLVFGPALSQGSLRLATTLRTRTAAIPRLRCRLVRAGLGRGNTAWDEHPHFDPALHVHHRQLPPTAGREDLADSVAEFLAAPLARERPLWELHVLGGLPYGRTAVVVKIHHALADGLRAVELGMDLFDDLNGSTDNARPVLRVVPPHQHDDPPAGRGLAAGLAGALRPLTHLVDPRNAAAGLLRQAKLARETAGIATAVANTLFSPAPPSPLNVTLGPTRRFATHRVDLDDVHLVRQQHGGTVNDVVLAVVAGGLRTWMTTHGHLPDKPLRVLVPVSRRHRDPHRRVGNSLSGYLVDLPTGEPDPLARLHLVRGAMSVNKKAGPLRGPGAFPVLAERLPPQAHRMAASLIATLAAPVAARLFNAVDITAPS
jgi:diacylglycerol O-acyltransferase